MRVGYPADPHAPVFTGVATDLDLSAPLACADVALEDDAEHVLARGRIVRSGGPDLARELEANGYAQVIAEAA